MKKDNNLIVGFVAGLFISSFFRKKDKCTPITTKPIIQTRPQIIQTRPKTVLFSKSGKLIR